MSETRYFDPAGNVQRVGYSEANRRLVVRFKTGALYVYKDVPPEVYEQLEAEHQRGGKVAALVTKVVREKGFEYERVAS